MKRLTLWIIARTTEDDIDFYRDTYRTKQQASEELKEMRKRGDPWAPAGEDGRISYRGFKPLKLESQILWEDNGIQAP